MLTETQLNQLRAIVGPQNVPSAPAELIAYSYDGTPPQHPPYVAVTPATTEAVSAVMRFAYREGIPVIGRGGRQPELRGQHQPPPQRAERRH